MRESLRKSLQDTPAKGFERYLKGSIVLCNGCGMPIAFLDSAIEVGDGAGTAASKMKPLAVQQLVDLSARDDIDAGVRTMLRSMAPDRMKTHCAALHEFKSGDPMICPICGGCFAQVLAIEYHEVLDRAYTIEFLVIPPHGRATPSPVRGKQIGANKDWIHEGRVH